MYSLRDCLVELHLNLSSSSVIFLMENDFGGGQMESGGVGLFSS
jgi:hypothetical protein